MSKKYRLVTRSDMDGLVCAVLLKSLDLVEEIVFVHPKDMQDGKVNITNNDITTNLPYRKEAHLVFDHHFSEKLKNDDANNYIIDATAPSASRVVYEHYGKEKFQNISEDMIEAVDRADSAQFTKSDIFQPRGWVLLNFIMDARTGLGRFKEFTIPNQELMMHLIDDCATKDIDEILEMNHIQERIEVLQKYRPDFEEQVQRCAYLRGDILVIDLREEEIIYPGNRFYLYLLYPEISVSIHILWGLNKQNTVLAVGKSIFNKSSEVNIGVILLSYGGGGHKTVGTCQIENNKANGVLNDLIDKITEQHQG